MQIIYSLYCGHCSLLAVQSLQLILMLLPAVKATSIRKYTHWDTKKIIAFTLHCFPTKAKPVTITVLWFFTFSVYCLSIINVCSIFLLSNLLSSLLSHLFLSLHCLLKPSSVPWQPRRQTVLQLTAEIRISDHRNNWAMVNDWLTKLKQIAT